MLGPRASVTSSSVSHSFRGLLRQYNVFLCLEKPPHHLMIKTASRPPPPSYLRRTPPSSEALRHSGGERRRCTSPTVTLYLEVELSSERRPGTEQKTSAGLDTAPMPRPSLPMVKAERDDPFSLDGMGTGTRTRTRRTRCEGWTENLNMFCDGALLL